MHAFDLYIHHKVKDLLSKIEELQQPLGDEGDVSFVEMCTYVCTSEYLSITSSLVSVQISPILGC